MVRTAATGSLQELEEILCSIGSTTDPVLPIVLKKLGEALGFEQAAAYRVSGGEGLSLEFLEEDGFRPGILRPNFEAFLEGAPKRIGGYDLTRPEPEQRNSVRLVMHDLDPEALAQAPMLRELFPKVGLAGRDQLRALICDGPSLIAWVGGFRVERFTEAEAAAMQSIVPALRDRLALERRLLDGALARAALDAALEQIGAAAFLVDGAGRIRHANAVGRAIADAAPLGEEIRSCLRGEPSGYAATHVEAQGLPPHRLLVRRRAPADPAPRLEGALVRWELTPRQRDVLALVVQGLPNKTISDTLRCAASTVELHVSALLKKAGVESRAELVARFWSAPG